MKITTTLDIIPIPEKEWPKDWDPQYQKSVKRSYDIGRYWPYCRVIVSASVGNLVQTVTSEPICVLGGSKQFRRSKLWDNMSNEALAKLAMAYNEVQENA